MNEPDERLGLPSASAFDGDFRCPGKRELCKTVPIPAQSKAADRGERIHSVLEGKLPASELCESDQTTAQIIMHQEAALVHEYGFEGAKVIREERLWAVNGEIEPCYSGRIDCLYLYGKRGLCIDYKAGFSSVTPIKSNWQIKGQVALVATHYDVDSVIAVLIHPHSPDGIYQVDVYDHKRIQETILEVEQQIEQITENAPRTPNPISCKYCAAKNVCPEYRTTMSQIVPLDGGDLVKPNWEAWTPEQWGTEYGLLTMAEEMIAEMKSFITEKTVKDPKSIAGYKIVKSNTRSIVNSNNAHDSVSRKFGSESADACMKFSLSDFEAILKKKGLENKEISREVESTLGDTLQVKPKKPFLKRCA